MGGDHPMDEIDAVRQLCRAERDDISCRTALRVLR
jgi:hypothetical protein